MTVKYDVIKRHGCTFEEFFKTLKDPIFICSTSYKDNPSQWRFYWMDGEILQVTRGYSELFATYRTPEYFIELIQRSTEKLAVIAINKDFRPIMGLDESQNLQYV